MKKNAPNQLALAVALSAALAPSTSLARLAETRQGVTPTLNLNEETDLTPQETGAEPLFSFPEAPPNPFDFGACPSGTCPVAPIFPENDRAALRPEPESENIAIQSVARVYNAYRETLPATGTAVGTMKRDVVEKGSGAFVSDATGAKYVLTAAHIFRDGRGAITVESVDGRDFSATLVLASEEYDVALLRLADGAAQDVPALSVSSSWPKPGEVVWRAGFGPNETLKTASGTVKGYVKTSRNDAYETLKIDGAARQGDSGGPICNGSGEIVGVLWGTDGSDVYATYSGRILKTLCDYSAAFAPPEFESPFAAQDAAVPPFAVEIPAPVETESEKNERLALNQNISTIESPNEPRPTFQENIVAMQTVAAARSPVDAAKNFANECDKFFWNAVLALLFLLTFSRLVATFNEKRDAPNDVV